jgi:hypothetical protein
VRQKNSVKNVRISHVKFSNKTPECSQEFSKKLPKGPENRSDGPLGDHGRGRFGWRLTTLLVALEGTYAGEAAR